MQFDEFVASVDFLGISEPLSPAVAVNILRHLDRREDDGFRWFALPAGRLAGPETCPILPLVGVPLRMLNTMVRIEGRPDVFPLFAGVLDAAIYLCGANLMRYLDREFRPTEGWGGPGATSTARPGNSGALLSSCEGDPPRESLAKVFDEVSRTPYEGRGLVGKLVLGKKENFLLSTEFAAPIDFSGPCRAQSLGGQRG